MEAATLAHPIHWQLLGVLMLAAAAAASLPILQHSPPLPSPLSSPGIGINGHIAFIEPPPQPDSHIPSRCYITHVAECNRKVRAALRQLDAQTQIRHILNSET
jgi:hypothetical protein